MMTGNPKQPCLESSQGRWKMWSRVQKQPLGGQVQSLHSHNHHCHHQPWSSCSLPFGSGATKALLQSGFHPQKNDRDLTFDCKPRRGCALGQTSVVKESTLVISFCTDNQIIKSHLYSGCGGYGARRLDWLSSRASFFSLSLRCLDWGGDVNDHRIKMYRWLQKIRWMELCEPTIGWPANPITSTRAST